jgi:hypothetical protein
MPGLRRRSGYKRVKHDWYREPPWLVDQMLDQLEADNEPFIGEVLDPCCGGGTIPARLIARGIPARGSDKIDRGYRGPFEVRSVFDISEQADNVMSNVPYVDAEKILRHLLNIVRRRILLVLPLPFLGSQERNALFREFPIHTLYPCSDRPSMPPGMMTGRHDESGALLGPPGRDGTAEYAWFRFEVGYRGPMRIRLLELAPLDRRQLRLPGLPQRPASLSDSPQASLWC